MEADESPPPPKGCSPFDPECLSLPEVATRAHVRRDTVLELRIAFEIFSGFLSFGFWIAGCRAEIFFFLLGR